MIHIDYLKNHTDFIPEIAKAFFAEWSHLVPGMDLQGVVERLQERLNTDCLPLAFVAYNDRNEWIGTAQLKEHDMDERPNLSPWFAGFYVKESYRKQGVGERLLNGVIQKAKAIGIAELYLFTERAEAYYAKRGWLLLEKVPRGDASLAVMKLSV